MISASSQILVARQLAGLLRAKWSTLDALGFVTTSLPPGALRALCERALQAMRAGVGEGQPLSSDPLGRALGNGAQAVAETFDCLAEALQAREQAQSAQESMTQLARLLVVGPLVLGALFGWISPLDDVFAAQTLPLATELDVAFIHFLKWAGLPLALAAWFLVPRVLVKHAPWSRDLRVAAALYEFAASNTLGPRDFHLTRPEQDFLAWRESIAGASVAAQDLGAFLVIEGRQTMGGFERFAPVAAAVVGLVLFSAVLSPLLLPIFSIAGSIK